MSGISLADVSSDLMKNQVVPDVINKAPVNEVEVIKNRTIKFKFSRINLNFSFLGLFPLIFIEEFDNEQMSHFLRMLF